MSRFGPSSISPWRILAVGFSVFSLTILYGAYRSYLIMPRIYVATARIQVLNRTPPESIPADMERLRTADVLLPLIDDLQLDKIWAKRVFRSGLDALPAQDALRYLNSNLEIACADGSNIIDIRVSSEIPKEAADIANAMVDRYTTVRQNETDQELARATGALNAQIAAQQKSVEARKAELDGVLAALARKGIVIAPGLAGIVEADVAAGRKDATAGGHANAGALEPLRDLERQIDEQQSVLDRLTIELRLLRSNADVERQTLRIVERADPPEFPSLPNHNLNLAFATMAGIVLAVIVAVLVEVAAFFLPSSRDPAMASPGPLSSSERY